MTAPEASPPPDETPEVWGTTEFLLGPHVGLVGHTTFGLVESGHSSTRDQLWQLVAADAPIDDILDALSANGLKALPSFGLAQIDGDRLRVVARGGTRIVGISTDGSEREIDPSGVRTWREEVLTDTALLKIALVDADSEHVDPADVDDGGDRFFVLAGSVPAVSLTRHFDVVDPHAAAAQHGWSAGPSAPLESGATIESDDDVLSIPELSSSSTPESEHVQAIVESESESAPVPDPEVDVDAPADDAVPPDGEPGDDGRFPLDSNETISPTDLGRFEESPPASVSSDPDEAPADDNYDFIYGHTVARSVEGAAVRVEESDEEGEGEGLISSVPVSTGDVPSPGDHDGHTNPAVAAPVPTESTLAGDHDGLTMTREQLAALRQAESEPAPTPGANEVLAVMCDARHPNPPQAATCRSCGVPLGTARPVSVPRPPLGVLVFSNGDRIIADRQILIGRNPRITGTSTSELPRIVKFESAGQGLSRTHAEVRLEGWQMLLEDLQSTNGTEVVLPGQAVRRMHAGEPVVIVPGTSIDFGDELTCTVEVAP